MKDAIILGMARTAYALDCLEDPNAPWLSEPIQARVLETGLAEFVGDVLIPTIEGLDAADYFSAIGGHPMWQ